MSVKHISKFLAIVWATTAHAEPFCLMPVAGSEAQLNVEIDQPYRIATSPKIILGFEGLVVKAVNRHALYEFNGVSLNLIESDFPHVRGFAFEHGIHIAPNLDGYGFGSDPRMIFYARHGSSNWDPIAETQDYYHAFFDQGAGAVYVRSTQSDSISRIENGRVRAEANLPVFNGDRTISIRTVPEINGALALTGRQRSIPSESSSIWFRSGEGAWERIAMDFPEGERLLDTLEGAAIHEIDSLVKIFPANSAFEPIIFQTSTDGLVFVGTAPRGKWDYYPPSMTWIGWSGQLVQPTTRAWLGFWEVDAETMPPIALVLGPNATEVRVVPNLRPPSQTAGNKIFYRPETIILAGDMPALIRSEEGIASFDGVEFTEVEALRYEDVGDFPLIRSLGDAHLVHSERGIFFLNDDLSIVHIDSFPVAEPWPHETSIDYVDAWQTYVIVDRPSGTVFVSSNMRNFFPIASTERISKFVGVLPKPTSVLVVGESRLFAVTDRCVQ